MCDVSDGGSPGVSFAGFDLEDAPSPGYSLDRNMASFDLHVPNFDHHHQLQTAGPKFGHQTSLPSGNSPRGSSAHDTSNEDYFDDDVDGERESSATFGGLSHGFSLGNICPNLTRNSSMERVFDDDGEGDEDIKEDNEEDLEEDEGISEVYGHSEMGVMAPSPITGKRHVISKIERVGHIAQNLALGHRVGIMADDTQLYPQPVSPDPQHYIVDEDSPLQLDVRWSPPINASNFAKLTYETQLQVGIDSDWEPVGSSCQPVVRVYHTDDVMFIGRNRICRQRQDFEVKLRVRACGEIKKTPPLQVTSEWSHDILVLFMGYESEAYNVQVTAL